MNSNEFDDQRMASEHYLVRNFFSPKSSKNLCSENKHFFPLSFYEGNKKCKKPSKKILLSYSQCRSTKTKLDSSQVFEERIVLFQNALEKSSRVRARANRKLSEFHREAFSQESDYDGP